MRKAERQSRVNATVMSNAIFHADFDTKFMVMSRDCIHKQTSPVDDDLHKKEI